MPPVQSQAQSQVQPQVQSQAFLKDLERLETLAYAPVVGHEALVRNLGKIYETVATADFSKHDLAAITLHDLHRR